MTVAEPPVKPEMSDFERAFEAAGEPAVVKEPEMEAVAAPAREDPKPAEKARRAPDLKKAAVAPVKVEKAAEPEKPKSEFDDLPEPHFKDANGATNFKALREKARAIESAKFEADSKVAALEKRISDAEAKGKDSEDLKVKLTKLEAENVENLKLVRQANIELDPEFRREFIDGRASRITRAQQIIEESGGDPKAISTALNLSGKSRVEALIEATQDLPAFQQSRLGKVIEELTDLDERAAAKRTSPETYLAERQKQTQAEETRQREQTIAEKRQAWTIAQDEVRRSNELFQPADGRDEHNRSVETEFQEAQRRFEAGLSPLDTAKDAILARSVPRLIEYVRAEQEYSAGVERERDDLKKELSELYGKAPALRGGGGGDKQGKKGFWDVMNADE